MGIRVGMVGVGSFAHCFIPLFKAHPLVDHVTLCDVVPEKLAKASVDFGIPDTSPSLDALLQTDVDAVAIITQHWMHGPQALQALEAGKDVYSAVPAGVTVDEVLQLVQAVQRTGRIYMMGETSYYYPQVIWARQAHREGRFGRMVYAEGEYYHDMDHGLYEVLKARAGDRWREFGGSPPMHYPTHSVGCVLGVTGARALGVSCRGFVDRHADGVYDPAVNLWQNPFSNETALFEISDGSTMRINEFRRVGHPGCERGSQFGTDACLEVSAAGAVFVNKQGVVERLDDQFRCTGRSIDDPSADPATVPDDRKIVDTSRVHPIERLPRSFAGLPNSHQGSHQFLVDDFVQACVARKHPPVNVWEAAAYTLPGLVAHQSAMDGGAWLPIPDPGLPGG